MNSMEVITAMAVKERIATVITERMGRTTILVMEREVKVK